MFEDKGIKSLPEIHPLFHEVVYLYLAAWSLFQDEQILGGGRIGMSAWQRYSCHFFFYVP